MLLLFIFVFILFFYWIVLLSVSVFFLRQSLATAQGNILENRELIESLNQTKASSALIQESLLESHRLQTCLDQVIFYIHCIVMYTKKYVVFIMSLFLIWGCFYYICDNSQKYAHIDEKKFGIMSKCIKFSSRVQHCNKILLFFLSLWFGYLCSALLFLLFYISLLFAFHLGLIPIGTERIPSSCWECQQDVLCHHRPVQDQQHVSLQPSIFSASFSKSPSDEEGDWVTHICLDDGCCQS